MLPFQTFSMHNVFQTFYFFVFFPVCVSLLLYILSFIIFFSVFLSLLINFSQISFSYLHSVSLSPSVSLSLFCFFSLSLSLSLSLSQKQTIFSFSPSLYLLNSFLLFPLSPAFLSLYLVLSISLSFIKCKLRHLKLFQN